MEETWRELFAENGAEYEFAILVLYRDAVESACGVAPAATGPFYCPADTSGYLDLSFYETLRDRYGAAGDFAEAYMIAHEIGHHVQRLTGTMDEVGRVQAADPSASNELSVLLELQADRYAGVWAAAADRRGIMERGDLHERLQAAAAVGDDRLSQPAGRIPNLETFTHGSSEQRMGWFRTGYEAGVPAASDTFARE